MSPAPSSASPRPERDATTSRALGLLTVQERDRRAHASRPEIPALHGDTPVSDSSVFFNASANADTTPTLAQRDPWPEDEVGAAPRSVTEEIQRARILDERRLATAQQLVGAATTAPQDATDEFTEEHGDTQRRLSNSGEREDADGRAMLFASAQAQSHASADATASDLSLAQSASGAVQNTKAAARLVTEGIQLALAETVVPLLTLIAQLNFQLVYKYFISKSKKGAVASFFMPTVPEELAAIGLDCGACGCCSCVIALFVGLMVTVVFGFVTLGQDALSFMSVVTDAIDFISEAVSGGNGGVGF